jgi:hypothetical protein
MVSFTTLTPPSVSTQAVTNITGTTAKGNGNITNLGNPNSITAYGVCYSKINTVPTLSDSSVNNGTTTTTGTFSSSISGLDENTTYYMRAYATNMGGTVYGNAVSFTTLAKPGVTTQAATSVSNTNAIANWSITNLGNPANVTACGVCWSSTNSSPTLADAKIDKGVKSATGSFTDTLTGLTKNTTYYARAYATNAAGTTYGAAISFTTIPQSFTYTIQNEVQTSDRTLEFDLYLLNTDAATPIQIASVQSGIFVNSAIANGGTITSSIVSGSSDMNLSQQPSAISGITNTAGYYVRIAAKSYPGCGNGTIMSTTYPGTKLCRVKLTNTTAFNAVKANMDFNFTTTPYATKVFYYKSGCSSTAAVQLVTNSINCYSLASNESLVNISYITPDSLYTGVPVTGLSPTVVGGTITGYNVSPALPAGLSLDATTGVISGTPRVGSAATNYTITGTYSGGSVTTVVNITVVNVPKKLSLKAYLQGFWNSSNMNQCKDENGNAIFPSATDTLTVELHNPASYSNIVYALHGLFIEPNGTIHEDGTSNITIPTSYYGSYFITIKTRNHLETTSASAVSFSGNSISYDFTTAANKAYGSNMAAVSGGYALYVGDVNQDGAINSTDVSLINDQINNFGSGYIPEDINGDGTMDSSDINLMEPNVNNSVSVTHP